MPLYEFFCCNCRQKFEILVSIGKEQEAACPSCKKQNLKKCISAFGIGGGAERTTSGSSSCTTCTSSNCDTCG